MSYLTRIFGKPGPSSRFRGRFIHSPTGSQARGDWVEDLANRYFSDYDLLVVVDEGHFIGRTRLWSRLEQELDRIAGRIPVTLLIHTLKEVNAEIRHGHYFFADIAKEGISLYDSGHTILATPKGN